MRYSDKYILKKKIKELGRISWDILVGFSYMSLILFLFITAMTFWSYLGLEIYYNTDLNILPEITKMFLIIMICGLVVVINYVKKLKIK